MGNGFREPKGFLVEFAINSRRIAGTTALRCTRHVVKRTVAQCRAVGEIGTSLRRERGALAQAASNGKGT